MCPPKLLYHSPSSAGQGRKNTRKGSWVKTRLGRHHSLITIMGKTGFAWGKKLLPIISEYSNEKSNLNLKPPSPHPSLPPGPDFTPKYSSFSPLSGTGDVEWVFQSLHHTFSLLLLPPHTLSLIQREVAPTGDSSPWTAPTWVRPTDCSSL